MLKLAYDFSRRAITTLRGQPIVDDIERSHCEWREEDLKDALVPAIKQNDYGSLTSSVLAVADNYKHSRGRGFQEHLQGVAALLERWHQEPLVVQIGLLHSAYSTQQYPYGLFSYADRDKLAELIGPTAERLVFLFCSHDRVDLYSQAISLCKTGQVLPEEGLLLRNALTGSKAMVPADLIARLLVVHAADLVEQMDGFSFEMIAALLSAADQRVELPACFGVLEQQGVTGPNLTISIDPARGTFGLAPVLGLDRSSLKDRLTLTRLLRSSGPLSTQEQARLREIEERRPALFEVPWIRYQRGFATDTALKDWLLEARARHEIWGVPWLKRPFDGNASYHELIVRAAAQQA